MEAQNCLFCFGIAFALSHSTQGSEKRGKNSSIPHSRIDLKKKKSLGISILANKRYKAGSCLRKLVRAKMEAAKFMKGGGSGEGGGLSEFNGAVMDIWSLPIPTAEHADLLGAQSPL